MEKRQQRLDYLDIAKAMGLGGPEWSVASIGSAFTLLVCSVVIGPIDKYIPQLFGHHPKNN